MRPVLYIIVIILIFGCQDVNAPKKPSNLLSENEMSAILYDIYVLNAAKGINKKVLELNGVNPKDYVYEKYNIDSLQFAESNNYYTYNVETYEAIINRVKLKIEHQKDSLKKRKTEIEKNQSKGLDSIKTLNTTEDRIKRAKSFINN